MTLDTPDRGRVEASLQNGLWAAWWPVTPSTVVAGVDSTTVTLTLSDGSSRTETLDSLLMNQFTP